VSRAIALTGAFGVGGAEPEKPEKPGPAARHILDVMLQASQQHLLKPELYFGFPGITTGHPHAWVKHPFAMDAQPRIWAGHSRHADMLCTCGHEHERHFDKHGLERCEACTCPGFELSPMSYCSCGHRVGAHETVLAGGGLRTECRGLDCDCETFAFVPDTSYCDCGHVLGQHHNDGPYSECVECSCLGWRPRKFKPYAESDKTLGKLQLQLQLDASAMATTLEKIGSEISTKLQASLSSQMLSGQAVSSPPHPPEAGAMLAGGNAAKFVQAQARLELIAKLASTTGLSPMQVKAMVDDMVAKGEL
jgi:hypothetical protein